MKNLTVLFALLFSFSAHADTYGIKPFKTGEVFLIGADSWATDLDEQNRCNVRIPDQVKFLKSVPVSGDQDFEIFEVITHSEVRPGECPNHHKIQISIVGADTLREKSADRVRYKASIKKALRNGPQSFDDYKVGDELMINGWFWAVLLGPTHNENHSFREDDLCRIEEGTTVTIQGFLKDSHQAIYRYTYGDGARFSSCPKGVQFVDQLP